MDEIISERIKNLIEELKVYDRDFSSYFIDDGKQIKPDPREPREAMKELVEIGEPAVEPLLELLEDIETWSILYAIEVLGGIGDVRAVLPLLNLRYEPVMDESLDALQKIGLPALEPVLEYLRSGWEEDDRGGKFWPFHLLSKIKDDRSYKALFKGLSHPDSEVREWAAVYLGDYGDKSAFKGVVEVFKEDPENSEVMEAVRVLAKDPLAYREVLAACGVVGRERIEEVRKNIGNSIREISYAYGERFKGDDAEKFNAVARLYKIRGAIADILWEVAELAVDEGAISNNTYEKLYSISSKIVGRNFKFHNMYEDILDASEYKFRGPSISESNRSYRGLTKGSWLDPQPRLDALGERIKSWLKGSGFKVHKIGSCLWARKKRAKKECLIFLTKVESRRIYGEVMIEIIGKGWIEDEVETFNTSFWKNVEKVVREIVGDADR